MSILLVSHGPLAEELLHTARTIAGELRDFDALCLDWEDPPEIIEEKLRRAVDQLRQRPGGDGDAGKGEKGGVLILTDLYGSTPTNAALKLLRPGEVEVVSGVNLPMVVRLGCERRRDMEVGDLARWLQKKGRDSVCVGSDRFGGEEQP